jgi:chromosomal replication initiator protein
MSKSPQEIWTRILGVLQQKIPRDSFLTWFSPLRLLNIHDGLITVGVPNQFFYEFLETHYREQIKSAISSVAEGEYRLQYQIIENKEINYTAEPSAPREKTVKRDGDYDRQTQLNPRYTFENFVEGDSNSFAKASALAVAEAPGKTPFNPLFFYSPSGLGKTHLLQAVGNFSLATNRRLKTIYVTSEKFVSDFISAIKTYKTTDFSQYYRSADLFLLDDIQFFQGKERTQMEFFHTFNSLYQAGKQIALSSDCPLSELDGFDTRLISRLGSGLIADIHPPDYETRLAILQRRAESEGIYLPDDVNQYIASVITDNIRSLESALIKLMAHCSITGVDITLPLAKEILKIQVPKPAEQISIEKIQITVAKHFNIAPDLLIARSRRKEVAWPRQVAMYLCVELTGASLQSIGTHFGNRDHSTVIHARNLVAKRVAEDSRTAQDINKLRVELTVSR